MTTDSADVNAHRELLQYPFRLTVPEQLFTATEVARLRKYGNWFAALSEGRLQPTTSAQQHFVSCMQGTARSASPDENLWRRYRLEQLAQAFALALEQQPEQADPNSRARLFQLSRAGSQIARRWVEDHPPIPAKVPRGRSADRQAERAGVRGTPWERMSVYGMRHLCGFGSTWHLHVLAQLQEEQGSNRRDA